MKRWVRLAIPAAVLLAVAAYYALANRETELVLTGIHIGDYGRDLPLYAGDPYPVVTLLREIFALPGLGRVRISSLEPSELSRL